MVKDSVWISARLPLYDGGPKHTFICIGCLEQRLGRRLTAHDFTDYPINVPSDLMTARLIDRLTGPTAETPT